MVKANLRIADSWAQYRILDASDGERLENWNGIYLIRPDPQIIWKTPRKSEFWNTAHAHYYRSATGGGEWKYNKNIPGSWSISYKNLAFNLKTMGFKHTGLFPEQAVNWDFMYDKIVNEKRKIRVLNLFAYTGGSTLVCTAAGAEVCHVDASKGMVSWAKGNAELSGLGEKPVRWIVDDCEKFIGREIKRGKKYDAVIMDPPSYGRGPGGEVWKLEDCIFDLVRQSAGVLSDNPLFFLINSYTAGLSPAVMGYILGEVLPRKYGGVVGFDEIGLPVESSKMALPCGASAIWVN